MKSLRDLSVRRRLLLVYVVVIIGIVLGGAHSLYEMSRLNRLTETLYEHPLRVSNASLSASMYVVRMHRGMRDVALASNPTLLSRAIAGVEQDEARVYRALDVVQERILGAEGRKLARDARWLFAAWTPIRTEVIALVARGERDAAAAITRTRGAAHVATLERAMRDLADNARRKADGFMARAQAVQRRVRATTLAMIVVAGLGLLFFLRLVSRSILESLGTLEGALVESTRSGRLAPLEIEGDNEVARMALHYNALIDLVQRQSWLREGLNRLTGELAGDLPYEQLCSKAVRFVSRHVGACAGAVYGYERAQQTLRLRASYALTERPQMAASFRLGEGIVGQVASEQQPILLRDIDRAQAVGRSATVTQAPSAIYAVPLLVGSELQGVLEVATFDRLDERRQGFVDAAAKILATELSAAAQHDRVRRLLTQAQTARDELEVKSAALNGANEALQATNEELQAQSDELQAQSDELMAQADELQGQRRRLETADRLKSEFLSNMSHELRTPLNSVMALSQLLLSRGTGKDPEQEAEYLQVIERNGRHLLNLINDILDLSKIEAGRMDLEVSEVDPVQVARRAMETVAAIAQPKGLKVRVEAGSELPLMRTDDDKIHQILLNLLSNAVKFTDDGEVTLRVSAGPQHVSFAVADTGIGIDVESQQHIFEEFRQVDGSTTRRYEGTGLGLAICQRLARLLGGEIIVESTPGVGSTFTLRVSPRLPGSVTADLAAVSLGGREGEPPAVARVERGVERAAGAGDRPLETAATGGNGRPAAAIPRQVLVVEDNDVAALQVQVALEEAGYAVARACQGAEALAFVARRAPDAIVLDLMMPGVDGFEVLDSLRRGVDTATIPVLVVTAKELTEAERARLRRAQANQLILKGSVDREQLVAAVGQLFASQPGVAMTPSQGAAGVAVSGPAAPQTDSPVRPDTADGQAILVVEDNPDNRLTMAAMLDDLGHSYRMAGNGEAALEMLEESRPRLILMDIQLPSTSGVDLTARLRSDPALRSVPIVAVTAKAMKGDREAILASGCDDYVAKPIELRELARVIERWVA